MAWTLGARFGFPENHCCVCGKQASVPSPSLSPPPPILSPPPPNAQPPPFGHPAWCQYFGAFPPSVLQVIVPPCAPQFSGAGELDKQELVGHVEDPDDPNTPADDPNPCPASSTDCIHPGQLKKQELVGRLEDPDNPNTAADDPNPCPVGDNGCVHPTMKPKKHKMQHTLVA
jgi:hypothetical protein